MSAAVGVLFLAGAFLIGVWLGWYAAHLDIRPDIAEYVTTSLPALTLSAGEGAARPEPPTRAGRASPQMPQM